MKKIIGLSAALCLLISVMAGLGAFAADTTIYDIDFDSWDINVAANDVNLDDPAAALGDALEEETGANAWTVQTNNGFTGEAKVATVVAADENASWTGRGNVLKISGATMSQTATAHTNNTATRLGISVNIGKDFTKSSSYDNDKLYIEYDLFIPSLGQLNNSFVRFNYVLFGVNDYATAIKHETNSDKAFATAYKTTKFTAELKTDSASYGDQVSPSFTLGDWYRIQYVLDMQDVKAIDIVDSTGATVSSTGRRTYTINTKNLRTNETTSSRVATSTKVLADKLTIGGYYNDQWLYGDFYLDNVNIYTRNKFAFASSADDEATNVSIEKDSVSFTMNDAVNEASIAGITLKTGANTVSTSAALSGSDNKTVVVTINEELDYGKTYTLDFSGVKREDGDAIEGSETKTISFTTEAAPALYVAETNMYSGYDVYVEDEDVIGTGSLYTIAANVKNTVSDAKTATFIVAAYDVNGNLKETAYVSKDIAAGKTETMAAGMTIPAELAGGTVKVFLWNNVSTMQPYVKPITAAIAASN